MVVRLQRMLVCAALVLVVIAVPIARTGARAATVVGPKAYYLALGDSLAFGYQPNLNFSQGYANDLFRSFQPLGTQQLINMGCPGATTESFLAGNGCPISHYAYTGSQLSAAVAFIQQHPGQVSPVTLDIGANDALPYVNSTTCAIATGFSAALATFDTNFTTILTQLHAALNGSGDLLVMNYYDPYQNTCASNPAILSLVRIFNQHIANDAAPFGVAVAPVFAHFGGATTPNPNICTYTWMCGTSSDIHATQQGYAVIAGAFSTIAGY